jgi:hypothetical protein
MMVYTANSFDTWGALRRSLDPHREFLVVCLGEHMTQWNWPVFFLLMRDSVRSFPGVTAV